MSSKVQWDYITAARYAVDSPKSELAHLVFDDPDEGRTVCGKIGVEYMCGMEASNPPAEKRCAECERRAARRGYKIVVLPGETKP